MKREIICPRCGKETFYVYRGERSGVFAGCEHCVEPLDRDYAARDADATRRITSRRKSAVRSAASFAARFTARRGTLILSAVSIA